MARQPHAQLCFLGQFNLGRVEPRIQRGAAVKACGRACGADVLQHEFVAGPHPVSGRDLMDNGLNVSIPAEPGAAVIEYELVP